VPDRTSSLLRTENLYLKDYYQTIYEQHRDDPVLNLAFAVACIGRAMTRKVDNRHYMIAQVQSGQPR